MKVGLALSGGGARGIAHLGVIKALLEQGIEPVRLSGVSAGAVVGAMYAAGHSPEQVLDLLISTNLLRFMRPAINKVGFLKMDRFETLYLQYFPANSFEQLKLPLTISATDINRGETVYFSEGELIKPLLASCCIPVMFEPILFRGNLLVDGGILNNLPVEPLVGQCDCIISVHTNPCTGQRELRTMRSVLERSLLLAVYNNVKPRLKECTLFIEPPRLADYTTFDIRKAREIFEIGYQYTYDLADQLMSLKEKYALSSGKP